MKSLALALLVLLGTTRAMACSVELVSWNMNIIKMITADEKVIQTSRRMGGVSKISVDGNRGFWVSHETCSFKVAPILHFPKHKPGQPAACPSVVGLDVSAQIDCAFPR